MRESEVGSPLEILAWVARQIRLPGWTTRLPLLETDGSLLLRFSNGEGTARARWLLPGLLSAEAVGDVEGGLVPVGLSPEAVTALARMLRDKVQRRGLPLFELGPAAGDPIEFTRASFGGFLSPWLQPGVTRWGPFRLVDLEQPSRERLLVRFEADEGDAPVRVDVALGPSRWEPQADGRGQFSRRDFRFSLEVDTRSPALRARLEGQVERLCGFAVARLLARDATLRLPPEVPEEASAAGGAETVRFLERHSDRIRQEAFIRKWKADYRWHRFLYPQSRCIANLFRLGTDEVFVAHESLECVFNEPPWLPADATLFASRRGDSVGEYWHSANFMVTDIGGADIVGGRSMARLDLALEEAAERSDSRSVVVLSGCLPLVIGDNPVPTMRKLQARTTSRFYWLSATNDFGGYTAQLVRDRLEAVAPADAPRDPLGVAIAGGRSPAEDRELQELLAAIGLHPKGVVLPDVSRAAFERVREASVFAWANQTSLRDIAELMFSGLPVVLLRPRAPVGLANTLLWLDRVVSSLAPDNPGVAALAKLRGDPPWRERLLRLTEQTRGTALAFVVDAEDLEILYDTTPLYAFSLIDVVLEMGFSVRFVTKGPLAHVDEARRRFVDAGLADRVTFVPFEDATELVQRLADPSVGAVFSDFTADPRAIAAGRTTFSEVDLEMGVEGFFRGGERLLRRCRLRPFEGLDRLVTGGA